MYNAYPSLFKWIANRKELFNLNDAKIKQNFALFGQLKETLNPEMCRGFVDAFFVHKKKLEVCVFTEILCLVYKQKNIQSCGRTRDPGHVIITVKTSSD